MNIYGAPSYQMGDDEALVRAAANAPITKIQALDAKLEIKRMRRALTRWLKYRSINDAIAAGKASSIATPLFKTPGSHPPAAAVMSLRLRAQRASRDQELATQLHQLLSEVFDSSTLPSPDVSKNPHAAAELATIAIGGKLPGESPGPSATGQVWLWPLVIVVGAIAFVITSSIRSSAEAAAEHEHNECVMAGKCTDTGFWLKMGAVALIGWILWEKVGLGAKIMGSRKGRK